MQCNGKNRSRHSLHSNLENSGFGVTQHLGVSPHLLEGGYQQGTLLEVTLEWRNMETIAQQCGKSLKVFEMVVHRMLFTHWFHGEGPLRGVTTLEDGH